MSPGRPRVREAAALCGAAAATLAVSAAVWAQMATPDRMELPGFWPTEGTPLREEFVGPKTCASCHVAQAKTQATTSMARTASRAANSEVLRTHRHLAFRAGDHEYEVSTHEGTSVFLVRKGAESASVPLQWAFGAGKVGQTYVFEKDGAFYEGRLSYFDAIRAAGFTPARALENPRDLAEAMGRVVKQPELGRCFGCHMTVPTAGGRFDPDRAMPGVTCEACHGPGRKHVTAMQRGAVDEARAAILNPARLEPADSVDFCGACHATFWDVKLAGETGVARLRSQPHRLQSSACWGEGDRRLTCVACHDPHRPLVREARAYDARCRACHAGSGAPPTADRPGKACADGGTEDCSSCHMPKYEVPDMHFRFTDHLIRVVNERRSDIR